MLGKTWLLLVSFCHVMWGKSSGFARMTIVVPYGGYLVGQLRGRILHQPTQSWDTSPSVLRIRQRRGRREHGVVGWYRDTYCDPDEVRQGACLIQLSGWTSASAAGSSSSKRDLTKNG